MAGPGSSEKVRLGSGSECDGSKGSFGFILEILVLKGISQPLKAAECAALQRLRPLRCTCIPKRLEGGAFRRFSPSSDVPTIVASRRNGCLRDVLRESNLFGHDEGLAVLALEHLVRL